MMTVLAVLQAHPAVAPYVVWLVTIVSLASSIDMALPQPGLGSHWIIPRRLVSFAALNFGNAANLRSPEARTWLLRLLGVALRVAPAGSCLSLVGLLAEKLLGMPPLLAAPIAPAAPPVAPASTGPP